MEKLKTQCMLTAEGRTPPSAVYKANFPTGIPIPYKIVANCNRRKYNKSLFQFCFLYTSTLNHLTSKIPKAQNPLTIGDNNDFNRPLGPVPQNLENFPPAHTNMQSEEFT